MKNSRFPNKIGETAEIFCPERKPEWVRGRIVKGVEHLVTIETAEGERISCNKLRTELYHEVIYKKKGLDIKFFILKTLQRIIK